MSSTLSSTTIQQLRRIQAKYRNDPVGFNRDVLKRPPYDPDPAKRQYQHEVCDSVLKYRVTVVFSGNSTGKDYLLGGLIPWWGFTRPNSLTMVTGVSQTLLGSVTFKEVRRAVSGSPLLSRLGLKMSQGVKASPQVIEFGPGWHVLGFSTTNVERASGQHAPELLAVINEGSGVEDAIYDAVDSWVYKRLLVFGNPIRAEGRFVDLIRQADADRRDGVPPHLAVNAIQIPSTDSPHADLDHSPYGLADRTWIDAMVRRYGADSLWVKTHIKAEVPEVDADRLIPDAWLDRAAAVERLPLNPFDADARTRRISCDLGEGVGRDSTAICVRDRLGVLEWVAGAALGLGDAAARIAELAHRWRVPHHRISYDRLGIGRDLRHHLARHGITEAIGYAGSGRPRDPRAFTNLRTEAAWRLRQRLNPDWCDDPAFPRATAQTPFRIPPDAQWSMLREELQELSYECVGKQVRLIPKEDLCAILGRSPDRSDALLQSFAFD